MNVKHHFGSVLLIAGLLLGTVHSARADSDGYYCTGPNYLAYELFKGPGYAIAGRPTHFLYVVRLRDSAGIIRPISVPLPRFQVHGMRCTTSAVQLLGWDSLYTIHLSELRPSLSAEGAAWSREGASRRLPPDYSDLNLGGWSRGVRAGRADTIALTAASTGYRFLLAIDVQANKRDCVYKVVTRLEEFDAASRRVATLTLFQGTGPMECGE